MFLERGYVQEDSQIILNKRVCHFLHCLNKIIGTYNYYHLHNENTI